MGPNVTQNCTNVRFLNWKNIGCSHERNRPSSHQTDFVCMLVSLSKELLVPFVWDCLKAEIIPNNDNYINWVVETCGYQYMLYYHFAFTYLLAFNLYTEATRKNHSLRMMAVRIQFAPLFYSFKHPKYQVLHLQDLFERAQCQTKLDLMWNFMKASPHEVYKIVTREVILFKMRAIGSLSRFYHLVYLPKKLGHVYVGKLKL